MDKKKLAALIAIGAIVAYFALLRPRQAVAAPVQQPVASAPAPTPPPDLGTQLANIGTQVTAGLGAINTAAATVPTIVPSVTAAVTQATTAAAAIPTQVGAVVMQVGTAATQLGTAVGTAANSIVSGAAAYLPYLGPAAALTIIIGGIAQTHRAYDPSSKQCCDVNALGMRLNCRYDWNIMQCIYEVYDYPSWPREKKVNMIFAELQSWRGKVQAGSVMRMEGYRADSRTPHYYYTDTGLRTRPSLATDTAPAEFRILNAEEIAKYRAIKAEIIAYNKTLVGKTKVIDPGQATMVCRTVGQRNVCSWPRPRLETSPTSEFAINWLY